MEALGRVFPVYLVKVFGSDTVTAVCTKLQRGYWRQRADVRRSDPPPRVNPGAFSGQRQGWKTPKRTLWQCTASVCVAGVHC